jgi:uncharacterized membrane protein YdjX (TVP38/TMEM64 family)
VLALALLFLIVFALNVLPAFAPPTWLVFSYIGFQFPAFNGIEVALAGALAATLGRLTLASLSRAIIRGKFLSEASKQSIDAIRQALERNRKITIGVLLLYAFSPFPSNYLFIAYGLTTLSLRMIAIPFLVGRFVSYSFWQATSSAVASRLSVDSSDSWPYLSVYFVLTQIGFLALVYAFARFDWRALLTERKFRWISRSRDSLGRS